MNGKQSMEFLAGCRKYAEELNRHRTNMATAMKNFDENVVLALEAGWKHGDLARICDCKISDIKAAQKRFREDLAANDWSEPVPESAPTNVSM